MIKLLDILKEIRINDPSYTNKIVIKQDIEDPEGHYHEIYFVLDKANKNFKNRFDKKRPLYGWYTREGNRGSDDDGIDIYDVPDELFQFLDKYKIPYKKLSKYGINIPEENIKLIN